MPVGTHVSPVRRSAYLVVTGTSAGNRQGRADRGLEGAAGYAVRPQRNRRRDQHRDQEADGFVRGQYRSDRWQFFESRGQGLRFRPAVWRSARQRLRTLQASGLVLRARRRFENKGTRSGQEQDRKRVV